ncbi:hypothetical protein AB4305_27545 [Nocardia sp. 2YAB30]|uniref:hypothetical protein n=1 Tax=unclassified Nocardia TaxID=2637762 RepID=UPI003F989DA8
MNLAVVPEHLTVIASQLGVSAEDLMLMLGAATAAAVPLSPGEDDVSKLIPAACAKQAGLFFPKTANGVALGSDGAVELPKVGVAFAEGDTGGSAQVLNCASAFGE